MRCNLHGGKSLKGAASPQFKTGRHSKYLPTRLRERYQEALDDPELIALNDEIALIDARLAELLGRIDSGESMSVWEKLRKAYQALREAQAAKDVAGTVDALNVLGDMIERGGRDDETWNQIYYLLDQRRKLTESERKRRVDMQQMVTAERLTILMTAVQDAIRRNVHDRDTLSAISADIRALISGGSG
jgi:hypothetical protein